MDAVGEGAVLVDVGTPPSRPEVPSATDGGNDAGFGAPAATSRKRAESAAATARWPLSVTTMSSGCAQQMGATATYCTVLAQATVNGCGDCSDRADRAVPARNESGVGRRKRTDSTGRPGCRTDRPRRSVA